VFSAAGGALSRIDRDTSEDADRNVRATFPIVREPSFYMGGTVDPVTAFPCLPGSPQNPTVQEGVVPDGTHAHWQLVEPKDDRLSFRLGYLFIPAADSGWPDSVLVESTMEWRRGEPWWSILKESDVNPYNHDILGAEFADGHLILGRLLGPAEVGEE
jgi:hypothetical protein